MNNIKSIAAPSQMNGQPTIESEARLDFGHGIAAIYQLTWFERAVNVAKFDHHHLNICLSRRPGPTQLAYLDTDRPVVGTLGRVMFLPSARPLRVTVPPGRIRLLSCTLIPSMIDDLLPQPPQWSDARLVEGLHLTSPQIESVLFQISRELRQPGFASEILIESLAVRLVVALIRKFHLHQNYADHSNVGGMATWQLKRIRDRAHAEAPAPRLNELAKICNLSVRQLSRAFRQETGMSVAEFVGHATVERARRLLGQSDESLDYIARRLGFSSTSGFSVAFRRAVGMTPSAFRRDREACE